ncbi:MAG: EamA family transporter, partial [Deltaproteobacteria bacterium]
MIRRHPLAALSVASFFFASMALLTRIATQRGFSIPELVFTRMGVGALGCVALWRAYGAALPRSRPFLLLARGLLGTASILLFFFALGRLPVGVATLLNYTSPLFTALFATVFLGERPGPRPLVGLAATFIGLALVVGTGAAPGALVPHGLDVALVLGIGACSLVAQLLFTDAMGHVTAVSA